MAIVPPHRHTTGQQNMVSAAAARTWPGQPSRAAASHGHRGNKHRSASRVYLDPTRAASQENEAMPRFIKTTAGRYVNLDHVVEVQQVQGEDGFRLLGTKDECIGNVAAEDRYVSTTLIQPGSEFELGFSGSPRVADGSCCGSEEIRLWICGQLKRVDHNSTGAAAIKRNVPVTAQVTGAVSRQPQFLDERLRIPAQRGQQIPTLLPRC